MNNKPYRCDFYGNPETCSCSACFMHRRMQAASAALDAAWAREFSGGRAFSDIRPVKEPERIIETSREKYERQRRERFEESERNWKQIQQNDALREQETFYLGWHQVSETQSLDSFWQTFFTAETTQAQKQYIRSCNTHLNNPVRQGEIVIIPTVPPKTEQEKQAVSDLQEDAKAASVELGKLDDGQVSTVNRHFELLDYYANQTLNKVKQDGLPSDYYAYASLGVGIAAATVEQHLKNINSVLLEINNLYAQHVAMAGRVGGVNYGTFVAERAALFKKLDGSFAGLSKRSVQLPVYTQVKRNLKLSTKSVVHNANDILKTGFVKNLGKRIANVAIGVSASRGVSYIGLGLGVASGVENIYEACNVNSTGECGKTITREVVGFLTGAYLGGQAGIWAVGGALLLLGTAASAPVIAIGAISAFVAGGALGGMVGATGGKAAGDLLYEKAIDIYEGVESWF